jgi:serine/threonine protein kinase
MGINADTKLDMMENEIYMMMTLIALDHLHKRNLIHRDVKSDVSEIDLEN